jgi:hypothetical protein
MRPRPSDDPVMNTRATRQLLYRPGPSGLRSRAVSSPSAPLPVSGPKRRYTLAHSQGIWPALRATWSQSASSTASNQHHARNDRCRHARNPNVMTKAAKDFRIREVGSCGLYWGCPTPSAGVPLSRVDSLESRAPPVWCTRAVIYSQRARISGRTKIAAILRRKPGSRKLDQPRKHA